jgi:hypothetical protein
MRRNYRRIAVVISVVMLFAAVLMSACSGEKKDEPKGEPKAEPVVDDSGIAAEYSDYVKAIDTKYAYDLAVKITEGDEYNNSPMGDRQSGSDAEHATADLLETEMKALGLEDVEKLPTPVDKWQFNGASIKVDGIDDEIALHSYATAGTPKDGIDAEIIYLGKGTEADYDGIDAKGKIILVDVDQRAEWWPTYPQLEAEAHGAAAILEAPVSGFSEIADDAYSANDICGPTSIPCTSITVKDSKVIQEKIGAGTTKAHLVVDNVVEEGGETYNIIGKIKGKSSDQAILYGAHYDAHFRGFQDDTIATTGVLAIAKAFKDSGYTPERDIWFVLHGAEEWGASATEYDWCTGAWELITNAHPEWSGQILTFFNFELSAYEFDTYTYSSSAPELYSMIEEFTNTTEKPSPKPDGVFKDGIQTEGYQTYTYSDDFSYYEAGVPSVINGFLLKTDDGSVFDFYYKLYHTNYDTKDTYNEGVMKFNLEYYGSMGIHVDQTPALELDYTTQYTRLKDAINADLAKDNDVDVDGYNAAVEAYGKAAESAKAKVADINERYAKAIADKASDEDLAAIFAEGRALNTKNLKVFKDTQAYLLSLIYETPIVPHESPQLNIDQINSVVSNLESGEIEAAVWGTEDADYMDGASAINGFNEWYLQFFSTAVTDQFYDMFYDKANADNQFWGTGRQFAWADVDDAVRSITAKSEDADADFSKEIKQFNAAAKEQQGIYKELVKQEIIDIGKLTEELNAL